MQQPVIHHAPVPAKPQLQELLFQIWGEFLRAAEDDHPLTGVTLSLTYLGKEPVVATVGSREVPHAHTAEAAQAMATMAGAKVQSPECAALLNKAARLLDAASKLQTGAFFETNAKH